MEKLKLTKFGLRRQRVVAVGMLLQAKLAVSYCWLPPVLTSYLVEVLRRHSMNVKGLAMSSPLSPKSPIRLPSSANERPRPHKVTP